VTDRGSQGAQRRGQARTTTVRASSSRRPRPGRPTVADSATAPRQAGDLDEPEHRFAFDDMGPGWRDEVLPRLAEVVEGRVRRSPPGACPRTATAPARS